MITFRSGSAMLQCDGCYALLGEAVFSEAAGDHVLAEGDRLVSWTSSDGRRSHVCSTECGGKVNTNPPFDLRDASEDERAAHTAETLEQ